MRIFLRKFREGIYIGDFVYGANDGIVTTFAVVAAATGALLSPGIIIILGLANLVADGFSMGASNILAIRTENELQKKKSGFGAPLQHGLVTFSAFLVAGTIPLLPYIVGFSQSQQFLISSVLAGVAFFSVGAARTLITKGSFLKGGFEMLFIGGVAAFVAYGIGWWVKGLVKTVFGIDVGV